MANGNTQSSIDSKRRRRRKYRLRQLLRLLVLLAVLAPFAYGAKRLYDFALPRYQEQLAAYNDYKFRREAKRVPLDRKFDGYINVLVFGIDDGHVVDQQRQADTTVLVSYDKRSGLVRFISLPRYMLMPSTPQPLKPAQPETLAQVWARQRDPATTAVAVRDFLGVSVHYYVAIDRPTLARLVDAMGGVGVYVEADMDYDDPDAKLSIHISKGYHVLDGATAHQYLCYRGDELGDLGRIQRQHRFMRAFYEKLLQGGTVPHWSAIARVWQESVRTDAERWDLLQLPEVAWHIRKRQTPESVVVPVHPLNGDEHLLMPDLDKWRERLEKLFPVLAESTAANVNENQKE